jgi:hypothetical protein
LTRETAAAGGVICGGIRLLVVVFFLVLVLVLAVVVDHRVTVVLVFFVAVIVMNRILAVVVVVVLMNLISTRGTVVPMAFVVVVSRCVRRSLVWDWLEVLEVLTLFDRAGKFVDGHSQTGFDRLSLSNNSFLVMLLPFSKLQRIGTDFFLKVD